MTQEKLKNIVKLATCGAIVLLAILLISLTYQFVVLSNLKRQKASLDASINSLTNYNAELNSEIDYFGNNQSLEDYYRANGYAKDGDILAK